MTVPTGYQSSPEHPIELDFENQFTLQAPAIRGHMTFSSLASYHLLDYVMEFFFDCIMLSSS